MEEKKKIVNGLVTELNRLLKQYNCEYTEDLHKAIIFAFDNIAETEYRKYLGKII